MTKNAMMALRVLVLIATVASIALPVAAQKNQSKAKSKTSSKADHSKTVLATVGSEPILYTDVERAFQKNLTRRDTKFSSVPRDTALDFLKLYTNYRLKVASAKERGMDKDEAVINDIANNRRLLSETWYFDKTFADARVDELARRRIKELKIGIILCAVTDPVSKRWDTTKSLSKANAIIARLNAGEDFEKLARDSSDDKETGGNGGTLPWISGGSIIKQVEDESYGLSVGRHSAKPIESRFGYFIVKLYAVDNREVVKFRHILLQKKDGRDSAQCDLFADSLISILRAPSKKQQDLLKARGVEFTGDVFSDLAKAYSDDKNSASKGGSLGAPYSRSGGMEGSASRLVPAFEEAVFALKDGQISNKVHTDFGVHVILRDSTKTPDAAMERDNAKRTYRRLYFEDDKRALYDSLKKAYGFEWVDVIYTKLLSTIDTTKNTQDTSWWEPITEPMMDQVIYRMDKHSFTVRNFTDSLRRRMDLRGYTLNRAGMDRAINKITDPMVLERATADLDKKYPDFAALMQEFNDGILLFKVEEQEVWSKLKFDTADAKVFYDTTKSRWMSERKYEISEIYVFSDSLAMALRKQLDGGASFKDLATANTQRQGTRDKGGSLGVQSPRTNKLAKKVEEQNVAVNGIIGPFAHDKGYSIVRLDAMVPPRQQTFEESITELAPAYQDALQQRLTAAWLNDVRKRFPVVLNDKNIDSVWGKKSKK
jgi:peptidyl-prolyl cis-trans isomerase SurA